MKRTSHMPANELTQLRTIKQNLTYVSERAIDAKRHFDASDYDIMMADLFYLREYLDRVDDAIKLISKEKLLKMRK